MSLRLWEPGHTAPKLAVEIVSESHPYKDYIDTPERASACGIAELWVYDPKLVGPKSRGGPHLLQVWSRNEAGQLIRGYAGDGPTHSPLFDAWIHPVATHQGCEAKLRISATPFAGEFWPTREEAERRSRIRQIEQRDSEIEERDHEIARLRAELARRDT